MASFTYSQGRYFKDGKPFFFIGADYQYYRDKRANWAARLDQLKAGGINVITFYIPWRHHLRHDPQTGAIGYDFTGRTLDSRDLVTFLNLIAERKLWAVAKPGPFIHSELNIGGLPDVTSPSFNPEIEPVRLFNRRPLYWEYGWTQLPSPNDPLFDELAKTWLGEVRRVIAPYVGKGKPLIGIQLLDETIYCTSNDAPWHFGYGGPDMRFFHDLLKEKYGTIAAYNRCHGTEYQAFEFVPAPELKPGEPVAHARRDLLAYMDWGMFHWRIRRDVYARYKEYLGIDLPHLTNYAAITPPIEEKIPDKKDMWNKDIPAEYWRLYPEWWFAMNRVDQDVDVYEYGMISWLGVAAYNINDTSSTPGALGKNDVFHRYVNTARRRRGINMEENWGFSKLYHPLSEYPFIPFFQTLASIAGGCTGYVVFTGVCHGYWLDELDAVTRKQQRTFPTDAPIGENGETGAMYAAMKLLNEWFVREGQAFLKAELDMDICFLIVPEYAAISGWTPDPKQFGLPHNVPRVGADVLEPAAMICNQHGINYEFAELAAFSVEELLKKKAVAVHLGFFLAAEQQRKLIDFAEQGGTLIIGGELPVFDDAMEPCTLLKDYVTAAPEKVICNTGNIFNDERALLGNLRRTGWKQQVAYSPLLKAFVYRNGKDYFIFFFNFDPAGEYEKFIDFYGKRLSLTVGGKTSGVLRVSGNRIVSYAVKGVNEYEGQTATVRLRLGKQTIRIVGDGSGYDLK